MPSASWHCSHHPKTVASAVWKSSTYIWTSEGLHHHHIPSHQEQLSCCWRSLSSSRCVSPFPLGASTWLRRSHPLGLGGFNQARMDGFVSFFHVFPFPVVQQYNYDKDWGVCQHSINWDGKSPQEKPDGVHSFPRGQLQVPAVNSCNVCTQQRIRKGRVVQMRRQAVARRWSTIYYYTSLRTGWSFLCCKSLTHRSLNARCYQMDKNKAKTWSSTLQYIFWPLLLNNDYPSISQKGWHT